MNLILYRREHCDLCDMAELLVGQFEFPVETQWIDQDELLSLRFGERVPVLLREDSGAELDWPFDRFVLARFLV